MKRKNKLKYESKTSFSLCSIFEFAKRGEMAEEERGKRKQKGRKRKMNKGERKTEKGKVAENIKKKEKRGKWIDLVILIT